MQWCVCVQKAGRGGRQETWLCVKMHETVQHGGEEARGRRSQRIVEWHQAWWKRQGTDRGST